MARNHSGLKRENDHGGLRSKTREEFDSPHPYGKCESRAIGARQKIPEKYVRLVAQTPQEAVARLRQSFRIAELEQEVRILHSEITAIKGLLDRSSKRATTPAKQPELADPCLLEVVRVTDELFPGGARVDVEIDPDAPDDPFVVFSVTSTKEPTEIVRLRREWHNRVSQIPLRSSGRFRLSIVPIDER